MGVFFSITGFAVYIYIYCIHIHITSFQVLMFLFSTLVAGFVRWEIKYLSLAGNASLFNKFTLKLNLIETWKTSNFLIM